MKYFEGTILSVDPDDGVYKYLVEGEGIAYITGAALEKLKPLPNVSFADPPCPARSTSRRLKWRA